MVSLSESATGNASPARPSNPPTSRMSAIGAVRGLAPPNNSCSASRSAPRNSVSVVPPRRLTRHRPSGFSSRRICAMTPGRSSIQCRSRQEKTASKLPAAKGRLSYSTASAGPAAPAMAANSGAGSAWITWPTLPLAAISRVSMPSWHPKSRHSGKSRRISASLSAIRSTASRFRNSNPAKPGAARARFRRWAALSKKRGMDGASFMMRAPSPMAGLQGKQKYRSKRPMQPKNHRPLRIY